jgi:hypothetical protein
MASDNSEEIERLNESIRSLQESLAGLSQGITKTSANITDGSSKASKALSDSAKTSEDAVNKASAGLKSFGGSLAGASKEAGKALLDTSAGLGKYSGAVNAFGGAINIASKSLGMLTGPVGLLVTVLTKLVGNALEFSDNVVKAHDSLSDMGATIGTSTDDLYKMGQKAGYSSDQLGILTKNAASLDQSLVILGGSASKGVKAFSDIAAISQDQREKFRNLGFSQEQVTEMQATYVKQIAQTGGTLAKTPKQLQEESVKYIKELNVLSELTGVSAKKQQEAMDKALANENFNAFIHKKERDRDAEADPIKKAALQAEIDKRKALAATIVATEGAASATGKLQALSSENGDIITEQTASLEAGGQSMRDLVASTKDATKTSGEIVLQNMRAVGKATREFEDRVGEAGYAYGQSSIETQKLYGIDNDARKLEAQVRNMSAEEAKKFAEDTIKSQQEKEKTKDANLAARNASEELGIKARLAQEKALKEVNEGIIQMFTALIDKLGDAIRWLGDFAEKVKNFSFKDLSLFGSKSKPSSSGSGSTSAAAPTTSAQGGKQKEDVLSFTSKSGSSAAFAELDGGLQQRVVDAAAQYNATTGKKLTVNSAKRDSSDQARLYAETVEAGRPGIGPTGMAVAKPGTSLHEMGKAIDIQEGKNDKNAIAALNAQGLYQTVEGDPVHFQIPKARDGLISKGPMSGYLVEQHGLELTAPLDPNSILKQLAETSVSEYESKLKDNVSIASSRVDGSETATLISELITTMTDKLDTMISKLSDSNETQSKILTYSMV